MCGALDDSERVSEQYKNADKLRARRNLHLKYTVEDEPFYAFIRRRIALAPGERLLECGAGDGELWAGVALPEGAQITLTDISPGMVEALKARFAGEGRIRAMSADAQNLPFEDGSYNVAVANHMLYHVPDVPRALNELARVLAPGGRLIAATNSIFTMWQLFKAAGAEPPHIKFSMESGGEMLARAFSDVKIYMHPASLRITDARDAADYIDSLQFPPALPRERVIEAIDKEITERGYFAVSKRTGLFICTK